MKHTISETPYGEVLDLKKNGLDAAAFLAKNRGAILDDDGIEHLQQTVRPTVSTPLVDIFNRASELGKLSCFTMFDLSGLEEIPTVLTLEDIAIDGKYISKKMSQEFQKAWLNLTPILGRRDAYNRNLVINDTIRFANQVARGILCMSYNDSDVWLPSSLSKTIIEVYSLLMAQHLKQRFNLDLNEYGEVRTLFAAYMAQMLQSDEDPKDVPPILNSCKFLFQDTGTPRTVTERLEKYEDERKKVAPDMHLNLSVICQVLAAKGPQRMNKLTDRMLTTFMSRSPMDSQNMLFAMDYPPYFVYLLLNNVRGGKNPMFQNLIKFGDIKSKMLSFAETLLAYKPFISKLER